MLFGDKNGANPTYSTQSAALKKIKNKPSKISFHLSSSSSFYCCFAGYKLGIVYVINVCKKVNSFVIPYRAAILSIVQTLYLLLKEESFQYTRGTKCLSSVTPSRATVNRHFRCFIVYTHSVSLSLFVSLTDKPSGPGTSKVGQNHHYPTGRGSSTTDNHCREERRQLWIHPSKLRHPP